MGGGWGNTASGEFVTVGGGFYNVASNYHYYMTVGGGCQNTADGESSTVSGGYQNKASGLYATVGGGYSNQASTNFATVPGGSLNVAGGQYSLAAGQQAQATYDGTFVWADSQNAAFSSTITNEFSIRAQNGVRIQTDKGIHLNANDRPMIVRDWDVFATNAPGHKAGIGRWGLFMEPTILTIGIPPNDVSPRYFQIAKYSTNGTPTMLVQVDQSGNITNAGNIYSAGTVYSKGIGADQRPEREGKFRAAGPASCAGQGRRTADDANGITKPMMQHKNTSVRWHRISWRRSVDGAMTSTFPWWTKAAWRWRPSRG